MLWGTTDKVPVIPGLLVLSNGQEILRREEHLRLGQTLGMIRLQLFDNLAESHGE
jgi:hypothetical protein